MEITLEQLLVSREERWQLQQQLLQQNDGCTLVCLTVIMPGNVKRNRQSLVVAKAAKEEMLTQFAPFHIDLMTERDLVTGFEASSPALLHLLSGMKYMLLPRRYRTIDILRK